jgi:tetratricopeptide (TPR) repeat protein
MKRPDEFLEEGKGLLAAGRTEEAINVLQNFLSEHPENANGYLYLAQGLQKVGRNEEAFDYLVKAASMAPEDVNFHLSMGATYQALGSYDEALEHFHIAERIDPENANVFLSLGTTYRAIGDYENALSKFDMARVIAPWDENASLLMGDIYLEKSDYDKALAYFQEAKKTNPENVDVYLNMSETYQAMGRDEDALQVYEEAMSLFPSNEEIRQQINESKVGLLKKMKFPEGKQPDSIKQSAPLDKPEAGDADSSPEGPPGDEPPSGIKGGPEGTENDKPPSSSAAPTPKITFDYWASDDELGYEPHARSLAELITHEETKAPLTISIKAPWGAGKTSLMRNVQHVLDRDAALYTEQNLAEKALSTCGPSLKLNELLKKPEEVDDPVLMPPEKSVKGEKYGIEPRLTVWFNAWKYQSSEQIWAGMAHAILTQLTARMEPLDRERFWLRLNLRRFDLSKLRLRVHKLILTEFLPKGLAYAGILLVLFVVMAFSPGIWKAIAVGLSPLTAFIAVKDYLGKKQNKLSEKLDSTFNDLIKEPDYEGKMGFLHLVESDMREALSLLASSEKPLVVFVDDLDRCMPDKVADVVEAINLFLSGDYPNCIFVLGMEPDMVAASLEVAYKEIIEKTKQLSLDEGHVPLGWKFMEKIIQLPLALPSPTDYGIRKYIDSLVGAEVAEKEVQEAPDEKLVENFRQEFKGTSSVHDILEKVDEGLAKDVGTKERIAFAEASKRAFVQSFKDRDPLVRAFVEKAVEHFNENPRQVKRCLNLYRFLSILRFSIKTDMTALGEEIPKLPDDKALEKFSLLSIRWPQALDCLRRKTVEDGELISLMRALEAKAMELSEMNHEASKAEWIKFITSHAEKLGKDPFEWLRSRQFREFLSTEGSISEYEGCGLW